MKKLSVCTVLFVAAAASPVVFGQSDDDVNMLTALPGTPEIDGEIDEQWKSAPVGKTEKYVQSESSISADKAATAKFRCLWDAKHLYILAEVTDANLSTTGLDPWQQDSVEIFVDENLSRASFYDDDDGQYRVSCEGETTLGGSTTGQIKGIAKKTDTGYVVEAAIPFQTITGKPGHQIGFELAVNDDSDGSGERDCIMKWQDDTNETYNDLSQAGTVVLALGADAAAENSNTSSEKTSP